MKTEWDYTDLADAYLKRPEYADSAIDAMVAKAGLNESSVVCDVGAGVAHLTLMLSRKGYTIYAVEPNDAMRANGIKRTSDLPKVQWFEGTGEETGMESGKFDMVSFGSSFNVCDRQQALEESHRILKPNGWFACMWNHRLLDDPLQQKIEDIIKKHVAEYDYGSRREDQTDVINACGLFSAVEYIEGSIVHEIDANDFIEGWKSHGTLHRQSEDKFAAVINEISEAVGQASKDGLVSVPYTTRIWMAKRKI
jgi:ubiquinone/menaquinone biosynthesis C-methylase UbiE